MLVPVAIKGSEINYAPWDEFADRITDMRDPLELVGDLLLESVANMFESEGESGGHPWDELTENYENWKYSKDPALPILVGLKAVGAKGSRHAYVLGKQYEMSGKMREELLAPTSLKVDPTRLLYAPVSGIAGFHQEGTPKMVERPPVIIGPSQESQYGDIFSAWMGTVIEDTGF